MDEPGLEHDMLWCRVDAETGLVWKEMDKDLVRGQVLDGKEYLELERVRRGRGRYGTVDSQRVLVQVVVGCFEVEPFVYSGGRPLFCGRPGMVDDETELGVESIGYLISLLDVIGHCRMTLILEILSQVRH